MPGCAWSSAASTLEKSPTIGEPPQSLQSTSGLQARGPSTPIKAARRQRDPAWRNPHQSTSGLQAHQTRDEKEILFAWRRLSLAVLFCWLRHLSCQDASQVLIRFVFNFIQPQYETHSHQPKMLPNNPNKKMLNMIPNDSR